MLHDGRKIAAHVVQQTDLLVDGLKAMTAHADNCLNLFHIPPQRPANSAQGTVDVQEFFDLRESKPKLLIAFDEDNALEIARLVKSIASGASHRSRQQRLPLIEADCLDVYIRAPSKLSNVHALLLHFI